MSITVSAYGMEIVGLRACDQVFRLRSAGELFARSEEVMLGPSYGRPKWIVPKWSWHLDGLDAQSVCARAARAPLVEIGQLLRHRSVLTTAIYAKVDIEALRRLAMPWPQGVAR